MCIQRACRHIARALSASAFSSSTHMHAKPIPVVRQLQSAKAHGVEGLLAMGRRDHPPRCYLRAAAYMLADIFSDHLHSKRSQSSEDSACWGSFGLAQLVRKHGYRRGPCNSDCDHLQACYSPAAMRAMGRPTRPRHRPECGQPPEHAVPRWTIAPPPFPLRT